MGQQRGTWRVLAVSALISAVVIAAGVIITGPVEPAVPPLATRLASLHTGTTAVRRAPFCPAIATRDVEAVLGGTATDSKRWTNGQSAAVAGARDVMHEFGCSWTGASGATASAWLFVPPVTMDRASQLIRSAGSGKGCTPIAGAAAFGDPSVALTCGDETSYRGLFGDAWLTCTTTDAALADRWCAAVLRAVTEPPA